VHHLGEIGLIWRKEKAFWKSSTWVLFVGSIASFLIYSGEFYPYSLFLEAWNELEKRRAHCRKWFSVFGGPDHHRLI
jgi:hypothetical protein